jgi:hypothetical protein
MAGRYRKVVDANGRRGWARMIPFSYGVNITTTALADGSSVSGQVTTDPNLPFILTELRFNDDADSTTSSNLTKWLVSIQDGESSQLLSNTAIPREAMFGTREFPRQLPSEVEIRPTDTLTITATNKTGAGSTSTLRVTFTGYKLVGFSTVNPEA